MNRRVALIAAILTLTSISTVFAAGGRPNPFLKGATAPPVKDQDDSDAKQEKTQEKQQTRVKTPPLPLPPIGAAPLPDRGHQANFPATSEPKEETPKWTVTGRMNGLYVLENSKMPGQYITAKDDDVLYDGCAVREGQVLCGDQLKTQEKAFQVNSLRADLKEAKQLKEQEKVSLEQTIARLNVEKEALAKQKAEMKVQMDKMTSTHQLALQDFQKKMKILSDNLERVTKQQNEQIRKGEIFSGVDILSGTGDYFEMGGVGQVKISKGKERIYVLASKSQEKRADTAFGDAIISKAVSGNDVVYSLDPNLVQWH